MSNLLLKTLNQYLGTQYSIRQAMDYLANVIAFPIPDRLGLDDWRVHVPMHLLEAWPTLHAEVRLTIFVMAHSATHAYESFPGPEDPAMN